jgi:hypothetical protein
MMGRQLWRPIIFIAGIVPLRGMLAASRVSQHDGSSTDEDASDPVMPGDTLVQKNYS